MNSRSLAIDASRAAEPQKTGVGWYTHHLIAHLRNVIPHDVRVVLYTDVPLPGELRPFPPSWEERVLRWRPLPLWSQVRLAWQVLRDRPDVLFVPAHVIPERVARRCQRETLRVGDAGRGSPARAQRSSTAGVTGGRTRAGCRPTTTLVTTIHDVAFRAFPEAYTPWERWYAEHATRLAVRAADRIIVPTRAVACDLERFYRADAVRTTVVHHGVAPSVISTERVARASGETPLSNQDLPTPLRPIKSLRDLDGLRSARDDERVLLYVGRLEYKKNIPRVISAFNVIAARYPDLHLVLVGGPGHGFEEVRRAIAGSPHRDRITTPGWLDPVAYRVLLTNATVFCFPTLAEGFGMPILEAMAAGVPVVTSRGGAHEEVAGDAALLVDPTDVHHIASGMERLLNDAALREEYVRRGKQRAAAFTWERCARATWEVMASVLSH